MCATLLRDFGQIRSINRGRALVPLASLLIYILMRMCRPTNLYPNAHRPPVCVPQHNYKAEIQGVDIYKVYYGDKSCDTFYLFLSLVSINFVVIFGRNVFPLLKILIPGVSVGKSGKNLLSSHLKARLSDQNQFYVASDQYSKCVHISLYCAIKGEKSIQGLRI